MGGSVWDGHLGVLQLHGQVKLVRKTQYLMIRTLTSAGWKETNYFQDYHDVGLGLGFVNERASKRTRPGISTPA